MCIKLSREENDTKYANKCNEIQLVQLVRKRTENIMKLELKKQRDQ